MTQFDIPCSSPRIPLDAKEDELLREEVDLGKNPAGKTPIQSSSPDWQIIENGCDAKIHVPLSSVTEGASWGEKEKGDARRKCYLRMGMRLSEGKGAGECPQDAPIYHICLFFTL